jgi:hypothetical protein
LSPIVGFQGFQVDSSGINLLKNKVNQRDYRISAIAFIPVAAVAYKDAYFGFTPFIIYTIAGTVSYMSAIPGFYGKLLFRRLTIS